jgi:UDP-glucose 4-epimerase
MSILVIGGLGFIGSNLVSQLRQANQSVDILDIKKESNVLDYQKYDTVFHLGGISSVKAGYDEPLYAFDNVRFLIDVLESIKETKTKLIFASSFVCFNSDLSPYPLSKKVCESYCEMYRKLYKVNVSVARISNVYPNPNGNICKLLEQKKQNKPLEIYGDGNQRRDFIHVDDVVSALIHISNLNLYRNYNVCSGELKSFNELAAVIGGDVKYLKCELPLKEEVVNFLGLKPDIKFWKPEIFIEDYLKENLGVK